MTVLKNNNTTLELSNIKSFRDSFYEETFDISIVNELFISGSAIDDFSFLDTMTSLNKLVFLACKVNNFDKIPENETIKILRLHNIKQNNEYIKNIDFISRFKNLEYVYLKMLGIETFPDVTKLNKLHTVCCSNRKLYNYSSLEYAKSLTTFIGWAENDNHRTPAESFLPILKNKNLKEFEYTQMSNVENKKLDKYVMEYCPRIIYPVSTVDNNIVNNKKVREIIKLFF
jgi:hypothetical protein